jgi:hypothetical protein
MVGKMGGFGLFGVVFKGRLNNFLKDNVWSPIDQKVINKFR